MVDLFKVLVIISSLCLLGISCYGLSKLSVELNYVGFLPSDSQLFKWFSWDSELFPREGELGHIYFGELNIAGELDKLDDLVEEFNRNRDVIKKVDGWYPEFKKYVNTYFRTVDEPIPYNSLKEEKFSELLTQFLFSPNGEDIHFSVRKEGLPFVHS